MTKDINEAHPQEMSRRAILIALGFTGVAAAVGFDALPASAAVTWGYPFTFRTGRSRGFTGQWPQGHAGTDYTPGEGVEIHSVADGWVAVSMYHSNYGEAVWINHADGYVSIYGHMQPGTRIGPNVPVLRGQPIGRVGNTGKSFGAHLHIEIQRNGVAYNPDPFIDAAPLAGASTPPPQPPAPPRKYEENVMRVVKNLNTGHVYLVGFQTISHMTTMNQATWLALIYNVGVDWRRNPATMVIEVEGSQFVSMIRGLGISEATAASVVSPSGGYWSAERVISDKVDQLLSRP